MKKFINAVNPRIQSLKKIQSGDRRNQGTVNVSILGSLIHLFNM